MDLERYLKDRKERVDSALGSFFPRETEIPAVLLKAVRYSLFAGGKRIRPILAMAAYDAAGGSGDGILPYACALEMIHTYSLIHDDLPALDDDDFRRGKETCHKVFGEAIAILAGDALLTEAFELLSRRPKGGASFPEDAILNVINGVAQAAGLWGMVGGQAIDIESEGRDVDFATVQYIHTHKTGAMIRVSVEMGARLAGARDEALRAMTQFGERIGLAFQIADDVLDIEGETALLGKKTGADLSKKKVTYPALLGLEESKRRAKELVDWGIEALKGFGPEADPLREIARFVVARNI
jgi:geranylgeranyl diphosphate synthase type II